MLMKPQISTTETFVLVELPANYPCAIVHLGNKEMPAAKFLVTLRIIFSVGMLIVDFRLSNVHPTLTKQFVTTGFRQNHHLRRLERKS